MSTWTDDVIACPACGVEQPVRIALGAHVSRAPEVRDDVVARRLHRMACACGARTELRSTFEYSDFERGQLLLVAPADRLEAWPSLEAQLRRSVHRAFELGSPHAHAFAEGLRARVVFGLEELREKLVVWSRGFDDALIECIKLRAWRDDPALAAPHSRLLVDRVTDDDALVCWWFARPGDLAPTRVLELPAAWAYDADRDRGSLAARFPELFRDGFVSVNRLLPRDIVA
ncbi:MAG TPA: CpXC domain-containing protein [Kofleriaceae bacterium]|nr:CpXC domain-containing protein [Kofleriaceae bacterium]